MSLNTDNSKCCVPTCGKDIINGKGVKLPEEPQDRKRWLETLNIENDTINELSLACMDHFADSDLVEGVQGTLEPSHEAVPVINKQENVQDFSEEILDTDGPFVSETVTENKPATENEQITEFNSTTESEKELTAEDQLTTKTVPLSEKGPTSENEPTMENMSLTENEAITDHGTTTENVPFTENQPTADNEPTTENEPTADNEPTTENVPLTENQLTADSEPKSENVLMLENELTIEYEAATEPKCKNVPTSENELTIVYEAATEQVIKIKGTEEYKPIDEKDTTKNIEKESTKSQVENICRLCMETPDLSYKLSYLFGNSIDVKTAIEQCIHPLKVSEDDSLPQHICSFCLESLKSCYEFRKVCLKTDKKLQENKPTNRLKRKIEEDDHSCKKQCISGVTETNSHAGDPGIYVPAVDENIQNISNEISRTEREHPQQNVYVATLDNLHSELCDSGATSSIAEPTSSVNIHSPPPLVSIKDSKSLESEKIQESEREKNARIDGKFAKVEEQLRKVLEDNLSEELMTAENIIIEVQSDEDEPEDVKPDLESIRSIKKLKLPLRLNNVSQQVNKHIVKMPEKVMLPKGIRVSKFQSNVGVFNCRTIKGLYDTEFCEADGYLFEYRLSKGSLRYLRCVVQTCPSMGQQKMLRAGVYDTCLKVKTSHNHEAPNRMEIKKQMFHYVMKRKMQNDKSLNFRNVYEEVCMLDPELRTLVPLRHVINEICRHQLTYKVPPIQSFKEFYRLIEDDVLQKLHFTHNSYQFYQERFTTSPEEEGDTGRAAMAVVFANREVVDRMMGSKVMYVDASFKIDTSEPFNYQLVTVLVWVEDSYYPILYALVSEKTQAIFRKIFQYLHNTLAPDLQPREIVTDYEANLYYALGETYLGSAIGGSCFYYTQNLYKKICALNLSRDLETNSYFRNIYHMLLMLPLLPVNTIVDGLSNIEIQAREVGLSELAKPLFEHVRNQWIMKVTPELFCVHRLENRINENVIAPFKKLRDFLMITKGKVQKHPSTIVTVVEKIIELEAFLRITYSTNNKKTFARDLSSSQKKNVLRAWIYIENHPKININNFFTKVLGYIKCMENQLWIWGFYRYKGDITEELINAVNFSIISSEDTEVLMEESAENVESLDTSEVEETGGQMLYASTESVEDEPNEGETVVMEAVIDENGGFVLANNPGRVQIVETKAHIVKSSVHGIHQTVTMAEQLPGTSNQYENTFLKYVYRE